VRIKSLAPAFFSLTQVPNGKSGSAGASPYHASLESAALFSGVNQI
jgi:hypothetical protein